MWYGGQQLVQFRVQLREIAFVIVSLIIAISVVHELNQGQMSVREFRGPYVCEGSFRSAIVPEDDGEHVG